MDTFEPADLNELDRIAGDDTDFKKELIMIFSGQIPVFLNNMKRFFEEGNLQNLAREAHTAKSSVLIFGMQNTGKMLKEIQTLAENKIVIEIPKLLLNVENNLSGVQTQLSEILNQA